MGRVQESHIPNIFFLKYTDQDKDTYLLAICANIILFIS